MNYSFRNEALWRWCLATFAISLVISLILTVFKPWGWTVPVGLMTDLSKNLPHWLTWLLPRWLDWPLTNTLFVLVYAWMKTSCLTLAPVWAKHPPAKLIRSFLQGLLVSCFCAVYSLPGLVIASVVLSTVIFIYFMGEFDRLEPIQPEEKSWYDYEDHDYNEAFFDIKLPKYGLRSMLLFFYTVIVLYGLNELSPPLDIWKFVTVFVGMPLIYANIATMLIVVVIILLLVIFGLLWLAHTVSEALPAIGRELWLVLLFWIDIIIYAVGWIGSTVANIWHWLFPPRSTATS